MEGIHLTRVRETLGLSLSEMALKAGVAAQDLADAESSLDVTMSHRGIVETLLHDIETVGTPESIKAAKDALACEPIAPDMLRALRWAMRASGMTLANLLGVPLGRLTRWERGETIPTGWLPKIWSLAAEKGINLDRALIEHTPPLRTKGPVDMRNAKAFQAIRQSLGWPQNELARRMTVTQPCISYWERGMTRIPPDRLAQIIQLYREASGLQEDADAILRAARMLALPQVESKAPDEASGA